MTSAEEPVSDDLRLRGTVLAIIALFGLAALGTLLNRGCSVTYVATQTPVPTDMTNTAVVVWGVGFALAAIPIAIHGIDGIPKTTRAYEVAFVIALILCCSRSPITRIVNPQDYVNWPLTLCFSIPSAGTLAAGALIRSALRRIRRKHR